METKQLDEEQERQKLMQRINELQDKLQKDDPAMQLEALINEVNEAGQRLNLTNFDTILLLLIYKAIKDQQ